MKNKPIGIFDSGIGGLTVVKEITKILPNENIIYLGDTARVPYGTRGEKVITRFALQLTNFLLKQKVKYLVVACNTISAICFNKIQDVSPVPILGVIAPSAVKIAKTTKTGKVGIIGTRATISSYAYDNELFKIDLNIKVFKQACPLFVPIAEEGLGNSEIAKLAAKEYLSVFRDTGIDTLHLGCTHYPLLIDVIKEVIGKGVDIIDSALPTAEELKRQLSERGLLNDINNPIYRFYVTDAPERVFTNAKLFFGKEINNIEKLELNLFEC